MAGGITQAGINYLRNLMRQAEQAVSVYHVALIANLPPGFTIGGEELDEPGEPEYERAVVTNEAAGWDTTDNAMVNTVEISFPIASTEWGQLNYWAICDQPKSLGGRVLFCGQFDEPIWVEEDQQVFLVPGSIGVDFSGTQWAMGLG